MLYACGVKPWEVSKLSSKDIELYIEGYIDNINESKKTSFESGRLAGFLAVLPYLNKTVGSPKGLLRFEWEEEDEIPVEYSENVKNLIDQFDLEDIKSGVINKHSPNYDSVVDRLRKKGML